MSGSSAMRSPRAHRGQVLIVGNGIEPPHGLRWPRAPRHADNIFDALGELTASTPSDPIATVAITSEHLRRTDSDPQLAIEALRRVDPSVRIVLLESARHAAHGIAFEGFDETLHCPLRPEDVARLFDEDAPSVVAPTPVPSTIPATAARDATPSLESAAPRLPFPQPRPHPVRQEEPEPAPQLGRTTEEPRDPVRSDSDNPAANPNPAGVSASTPSTPPGLGDTDLVDAILVSADGVQPIALQLMAQQTGWTDIQFTSASSSDASTAARGVAHAASSSDAVAVSHAGTTFGSLASSVATAQQLQPWADWLAHWLALDHAHRANRVFAFQDDLTGAWNRRFFNSFLRDSISRAAKVRRPVTVMVFDLDNFKSYNDEFGHAAGDEILRETVRMMNAVVRQGDRVCRIGGDEFAVIFADPEGPRKPGSTHPDSVEVIAKRFQDKVCSMSFPKLGVEAPGTLSISAGLATYPWDGHDPDGLLRHADELALESKRKGKNAITFGPGAKHECGKQT